MDGRRFDEVARAFAGTRSRRGVLKLMGGGFAAGAGALLARQMTTVAQEESCEIDEDCAADEICCVGACRAIECCIDEEDPNARCPEGTSCFEGICDPVNTGCATDDDCATEEICCVGTCRAIECCIDEDDPNARCPEGTSCFEGICDPIDDGGEGDGVGGDGQTNLPSTGVGSGVSGDGAPVGAILAAGAATAAALAARTLLPRSTEVEMSG